MKQPIILRLMQSVYADVEKFKVEESRLPADDGKSHFSYLRCQHINKPMHE